MCGVLWVLYVDYSRHAVGHICAMWRHICSEAYASNVKLCIPELPVTLLLAVSWYKVHILTVFLLLAHDALGIYRKSMAFEGHACYWQIHGSSVLIIRCGCFFFGFSFCLVCAESWSPHLDYSISAVGHTYAMWLAYSVRGIYKYCEIYVYQYFWSNYWLQGIHMRCIYWQSCFVCACEVISIYSICMEFEGHVCFWHIFSNNVSSCSFLYFDTYGPICWVYMPT